MKSRLQENTNNTCGQIFVRAGGDYIRHTLGHEHVIVGDEEGCLGQPINFICLNGKYLIDIPKDLYFNHADQHIFFAEKYILLFAGRDCPPAWC